MNQRPPSTVLEIERLAARLAEELEAGFVELSCPVCHASSGRIAIGHVEGRKAFDERHRQCYVKPFSDAAL